MECWSESHLAKEKKISNWSSFIHIVSLLISITHLNSDSFQRIVQASEYSMELRHIWNDAIILLLSQLFQLHHGDWDGIHFIDLLLDNSKCWVHMHLFFCSIHSLQRLRTLLLVDPSSSNSDSLGCLESFGFLNWLNTWYLLLPKRDWWDYDQYSSKWKQGS